MMDDAVKQKAMDHIKAHAGGYPTTKKALVEACNGMEEFSADEKKWFMDTLPDKEYKTADEVTMALGW